MIRYVGTREPKKMEYTKEEALELACKMFGEHGYIMTDNISLLEKLEELESEGVLIRADRAGDRNPVGDFNPSYTFIDSN